MKTETYTCQGCGDATSRPVARGQRPKWCPDCRATARGPAKCAECGEPATRAGRFCSHLCYINNRYGPPLSPWPRPTREPRQPTPKPAPFHERRDCAWCGAAFDASRRSQVFCSAEHNLKAKRNRRRGRQHGSTSHFTWCEFMTLFRRFDRRCAYCELPVDGQPDPDHVVPLSKGGSNSITNILPSCRACNSDKRDLLLHEWRADRERRGLEPRTTTWRDADRRVVHLTSLIAA